MLAYSLESWNGPGNTHRMNHHLADLGWVDLDFECSTACLILLGLVGVWQKLMGSWTRWWNTLIKVKPTQVHEQMGHPVHVSLRATFRSRTYPGLGKCGSFFVSGIVSVDIS